VPAPGPLEHVAGLLVARTAPFDPVVQRQLLAAFGLSAAVDLDTPRATVPFTRRLRTLARSTGVPATLMQAVSICASHPREQAASALRTAGLVIDDHVDAVGRVEALRDVYGMAQAALDMLSAVQQQQQQWQTWAALAHCARRGPCPTPFSQRDDGPAVAQPRRPGSRQRPPRAAR